MLCHLVFLTSQPIGGCTELRSHRHRYSCCTHCAIGNDIWQRLGCGNSIFTSAPLARLALGIHLAARPFYNLRAGGSSSWCLWTYAHQNSCFEAALLDDGYSLAGIACPCSKVAGLLAVIEPCIAKNCSAPNARGKLFLRCPHYCKSLSRRQLRSLSCQRCYSTNLCECYDFSCKPHRHCF